MRAELPSLHRAFVAGGLPPAAPRVPSAEELRDAYLKGVDGGVLAEDVIADLGCGGGNLVIALAQRFPLAKVVGFEVSDTSDPVWKSTPSSGTSEI